MNIKETALDSVGKISYVFGSDSINADGTGKADCSSFTKWVYSKNGISLGRTTNEQWTDSTGKKVDKKDLKEGDLVFFKNTYNSGYTDGVSHVGIYIGNGKFVHNSSGSGKTIVSSLSDGYYSNHYLGAKRFSEGSENSSESSETHIDLKWYGDLIVIVLCVLLLGLAVIFFISAFNNIAEPEPLKQVKKSVKKRRKKK